MTASEALASIASWLHQADRIVVFTGAGLSKASGILTYATAAGSGRRWSTFA
jgi:NAD-dependent SIR2 family protein deacetylase